MPIISMSLSSELLEKLDEFVKGRGYSSRSEAIRNALRDYLTEYELRQFEKGKVTATVTAISKLERRDVDERLTRLRHEYDDVVSGNMHIHIGKKYCLEIFITEGDFEQVFEFIGRIRATRGIQQVKYSMTPMVEKTI